MRKAFHLAGLRNAEGGGENMSQKKAKIEKTRDLAKILGGSQRVAHGF